MGFFLGDPDPSVPDSQIGDHEDIAERISVNAARFARENWRWADMQAYVSLFIVCLVS